MLICSGLAILRLGKTAAVTGRSVAVVSKTFRVQHEEFLPVL